MENLDPLQRLDQAMADVSDVYVMLGVDAETYCAGLEQSLRKSICVPFSLSATVEEPGFPEAGIGSTISGQCVAHADGYWLVYQSEHDRFVCFWGVEIGKLAVPGIFGSPLGCWSS